MWWTWIQCSEHGAHELPEDHRIKLTRCKSHGSQKVMAKYTQQIGLLSFTNVFMRVTQLSLSRPLMNLIFNQIHFRLLTVKQGDNAFGSFCLYFNEESYHWTITSSCSWTSCVWICFCVLHNMQLRTVRLETASIHTFDLHALKAIAGSRHGKMKRNQFLISVKSNIEHVLSLQTEV